MYRSQAILCLQKIRIKHFYNDCRICQGSNHDVENLMKRIKKSTVFRNVSSQGDFLIGVISLPSWLSILYRPDIIFVQPALYTREGLEVLELGSFEKDPLMRLVKVFKRRYESRILAFKQKSISNVSFVGMHPEMTDKQREALRLAVENGYYHFPKRITPGEACSNYGCFFLDLSGSSGEG